MIKKLKKYIEETIFPEYQKNEKAHGIEHIQYVIARSFEIVEENALDVNSNMVYTIAAYHDIGHHINDEKHEEISAKMMYKDKKLSSFFSEEERKIMKEAIEDHRASAKKEPRNIYGKIVSSADRNTTVEQCLERSYVYGKKQNRRCAYRRRRGFYGTSEKQSGNHFCSRVRDIRLYFRLGVGDALLHRHNNGAAHDGCRL